jgi:hypothetical protein
MFWGNLEKDAGVIKYFQMGVGVGNRQTESKWAMQNFDILKFKWKKLNKVKVKDF